MRFEAAELFAPGVTPTQVARRLQGSRKSAYAWHARWQEAGMKALRSKGPSGQPSRMTPCTGLHAAGSRPASAATIQGSVRTHLHRVPVPSGG
ncbi:helix-turn-helix domain-containing protein [Streptomyces sp. NBC_00133]|uniref:helix-turn-helix domain-containing protein n=1 Tax=Streptomyces sp. NBC_00133 TaxID=2903624 RepID=UPI003249C25E